MLCQKDASRLKSDWLQTAVSCSNRCFRSEIQLQQGWIYVRKNLKLSILKSGYSETVCPDQPENLQNCLSKFSQNCIKMFRNITQYFHAMLKNIINSQCSFNIKETQVCARADLLKCGRTSAHIFRICSVQNCLSQVNFLKLSTGFWNCLSWKGRTNGFLFTPVSYAVSWDK